MTLATSASAVTTIGMGDFSPTATTFDFDTESTSYANGRDFGDFSTTSPRGVGIQEGTKWGDGNPGQNTLTFNGLTVAFDSTITQFGLNFGGNTTNSVGLTFLLGAAVVGNGTVTSSLASNWQFYGFEDAGGFDSVVFDFESNDRSAVGLYDLKYTSATAPIPLPAALPMLLAGIGGLGLMARRRQS